MAALGITYAPMVCIDRCTPNPNGVPLLLLLSTGMELIGQVQLWSDV